MGGAPRRPVRMDWKGRKDRPLIVPGELLTVYQPAIGGHATLAWLNLSYALQDEGIILDPVEELRRRQKLSRDEAREALNILSEAGLLEVGPEGDYILREPRAKGHVAYEAALLAGTGMDMPPRSLTEGVTARSSAPAPAGGPADPDRSPAAGPNRPPHSPIPGEAPVAATADNGSAREALKAVREFYENRIGLLGPVQFEKLRFWVEEKAMSPDVVAAAIEETTASAETPRIQYLEGILRNWYNDGVRTIQDLIKRNDVPTALEGTGSDRPGARRRVGDDSSSSSGSGRRSGAQASSGARSGTGSDSSDRGPFRRRARASGSREESASAEGLPNAAAYRKINREDIKR